MRHHLLQFWIIIFILMICGLLAQIPLEKYQRNYFNFIDRFNSIPQEHINRQIEYANQSGATNIEVYRKKNFNKSVQNVPQREPYYIRDAKNPRILYHYKP